MSLDTVMDWFEVLPTRIAVKIAEIRISINDFIQSHKGNE